MTEALLREIVSRDPVLCRLLDRLDQLGLPESYIGAGAIAQTVWNHLAGLPLDAYRNDIDIAYFDPSDHAAAREDIVRPALADVAGGVPLDLTNQARVHLWYPERFGAVIPPFSSTAEAIATWPTTASAIGLSRCGLCAPFGLQDLFNRIVRPNRVRVTKSVYLAKSRRWKAQWPDLTVLPW